MIRWLISAAVVLGVSYAALELRTVGLDDRPMHCDEAVHTFKYDECRGRGEYRYDPEEYHGPTLYYATTAAMALRGRGQGDDGKWDYAATAETDYRIVAVAAGVALVAGVLAIGRGLGRPATVWAAVFVAASPAMVYYGRYYIHEMLLVAFTFGAIAAGYWYVRTRRAVFCILTGVFVGLMHATKETCIIAWAAAAAALLLAWLWGCLFRNSRQRQPAAETREDSSPPRKRGVRTPGAPPVPAAPQRRFRFRHVIVAILHVIVAIVVAAAVSAVLFADFGRNPKGPADSVGAYATYFSRAGEEGRHEHPTGYYLRLLLAGDSGEQSRSPWRTLKLHLQAIRRPAPVWSEALIVALAVVGAVAGLIGKGLGRADRGLVRFLVFYTAAMTAAYSLIPYKTPWCMLSLLHGMILLAGVGATALVRAARVLPLRITVILLLGAGLWHLATQALWAATTYSADNRNPYVYAHTSPDLLKLVRRVQDVAEASPDGRRMRIHVFAPESDYWPLPWYFRKFDHVGWTDGVPAEPDAPVIVSAPSIDDELRARLTGEYQVEHYGLRPHVVRLLYVRDDLWRAFLKSRRPATGPAVAPAAAAVEGAHRFAHRAMGTRFEIIIAGTSAAAARQAAEAAFDELDRLERRLSRFVPTSDVARINAAQPGRPVGVGEEALECLWLARRLHGETRGAFDVTVGALVDCWRAPDGSPRRPTQRQFNAARGLVGMALLEISLTRQAVTVRKRGVVVDLGGIAKGCALDRMAAVLAEYGVEAALLHGGGSTVLATRPPPGRTGWPVKMGHPDGEVELPTVTLVGGALSGSAAVTHGRHIIDPLSGTPAAGKLGAWAAAATAAEADALSTAFMVMSVDEVRRFCADRPDVSALLVGASGDKTGLLHFGPMWRAD